MEFPEMQCFIEVKACKNDYLKRLNQKPFNSEEKVLILAYFKVNGI